MSDSKGEVYTVIIRSSASGSRLSGNGVNGTYYVDWQNVLPKQYKRFLVKIEFCVGLVNTGLALPQEDFIFVESNAFTRPYSYDNRTQTRTNVICIATQEIYQIGAQASMKHSGVLEMVVNYPTENTFNISLFSDVLVGGTFLHDTKFSKWFMTMTFRPLL